jgi:4-amino-4-deoxy-L-arabinose transferase-like glycosyltransferase
MKQAGKYASPFYGMALGLILIFLLCAKWHKGPDPVVDFGRELYIPWQLSQGKILYRDIAHFNGPFSQYFNSWLFRLFGVAIQTLVISNAVILYFLTLLFFAVAKTFGTSKSAFISAASFLLILGVSQLSLNSTMNFITPYSHEASHALLFSLLTFFLFKRALDRKNSLSFLLAGLSAGMVLTLKVEFALALGAALVAALGIYIADGRGRTRHTRHLFSFCVGALTPPLLALVGLRMLMPWSASWQGLSLGWKQLANKEVSSSYFYVQARGTDHLWGNLLNILIESFCVILGGGLLISLDLRAKKSSSKWGMIGAILGIVFVGVFFIEDLSNWMQWLPLVPLAIVLKLGPGLFRKAKFLENRSQDILLFSFAVFSLLLLFKILLNVKLYEYGVFLAGPALVLLVTLLFSWLPMKCRLPSFKSSFRFASGFLLLCIIMSQQISTRLMYAEETYPMASSGGDFFYTHDAAVELNPALEYIENHTAKNATLLVLPEGVMINYLTRRQNPTPYINFMPVELTIFGENKMLNAFQSSPPDFVVVTGRPTLEYGKTLFGTDYGQSLYSWVLSHYQRKALFGEPPLRSLEFGVEILERKKN